MTDINKCLGPFNDRMAMVSSIAMTRQDIFTYQTEITWSNPQKIQQSVGKGEIVEFHVMLGEK